MTAIADPGDYAAPSEWLVSLRRDLGRLPAGDVAVLGLLYTERLSQRQIAERLDLSADEVKRLVSRALRVLGRALITPVGV